MAKNCIVLSVALLISISVSSAVNDISGRWDIKYEGLIDDQLVNNGTIFLSLVGSTLHGDSTLGLRGDGKIIGCTQGKTFNAAITFRKKPAMFIKLDGSQIGDKLQGSFTASSSYGEFYRGRFTASRWEESEHDSAVVIDPIPPEDPLAFKQTIYFDPELYWHNYQSGSGKMDTYAINYSRNTILMVRNVPFIWQWWL